jgi:glycosyltransferase involved in cell wall biosynthesis
MIGIAHGYGLGGSGSNLWTREAISALCNNGETVHLMCQELHPERYDFVTEFFVYDDDGRPEQRFQRDATRPGRCIVHKPRLNVLPTYVRPDRPSDYVRSILDLDDDALEEYLQRNLRVLRHVSRTHDVRAWHVNHTVLLSEALRRLQAEGEARYAVMPHGSALEYVVRHSERMHEVAHRVLDSADAIFSLNQEIRERLADYFPDLDLEPKTVTVRVGVDTERFALVAPDQRHQSVEALAEALHGVPRGRGDEHARIAREHLATAPDRVAFDAVVREQLVYPPAPDAGVADKLRAVDWDRDPIVTFVGRLIPAKGVAVLVAAFPLILERHPDARLVIVGTGWLREYLEVFLGALGNGDGERARTLLEWAAERNQEGARPFDTGFLDTLHKEGRFDAYVDVASRRLTPDRVLFTGYLEHHLLAHVFPLAHVAVFPSAVAEASPLVIPEAAACGCLPMGTDFAGMRHSLASLATRLPESVHPLMRLRPDPQHTGLDIAANVNAALDALREGDLARDDLRRAAVEEYDWRTIAGILADQLRSARRLDR